MPRISRPPLECIFCGKKLTDVTMKKIMVRGTKKKQLVPSKFFCTQKNGFDEPIKREKSCHRRYKSFINRLTGKDSPKALQQTNARQFVNFALAQLVERKPAYILKEQLDRLCDLPAVLRKMESNFRKFYRSVEESNPQEIILEHRKRRH